MSMDEKQVTLRYDPSARRWTGGEIRAKLRNLAMARAYSPMTALVQSKPDILEIIKEGDAQEMVARVRLKDGPLQLPEDDRVQVTVLAEPLGVVVTEVAGAMGMPSPFMKSTRARVVVWLIPYKVELRSRLADQSELVGDGVPLDRDGQSQVIITVSIYRLDASGQVVSPPIAPQSVHLDRPQQLGEVSVSEVLQATTYRLTLKSNELALSQSKLLKLRLKIAMKTGLEFSHPFTLQLRALQASFICQPERPVLNVAAPVPPDRAPQWKLSLKNADDRAVVTTYKMECGLGRVGPGGGRLDEAGMATGVYHAPSLQEAMGLPGPWPRQIPIRALLGDKNLEAGSCPVTLSYLRQIELTVSKPGFELLKVSAEVTAPGPVTLSLVCKAGEKSMAVAFASVSGADFATAESDSQGHCTLKLGDGPGQSLKCYLMAFDNNVLGLQFTVREGLKEGEGEAPLERYRAAQQHLLFQVENELPSRLASQTPSQVQQTLQVLSVLAGSVKVMNLARHCLQRRYGSFQKDLSRALDSLLNAIWECWLGDRVGSALGSVAGSLAGVAASLAAKVTRFAPFKIALSGLLAIIQPLQDRFLTFYGKVLTRAEGLFKETQVPGNLRQRLAHDPTQGPVPIKPGVVAEKVKQYLDETLSVFQESVKAVKQALLNLKANLDAAETGISELKKRIKLTQGPAVAELERELASLELNANALRQEIKLAGQRLPDLEGQLLEAEAARADRLALAEKLDMLLNLVSRVLNVAYNVFLALLLSLLALSLALVKKFVRQAGSSDPILDVLADLLDARLGDYFSELSRQGVETGGQAAGISDALLADLVNLQRQLAGDSLTATWESFKDWPIVKREDFEEAVRFYYQEVERNQLLLEASDAWTDFISETADLAEWFILWCSRLGAAIGRVAAILASAGTATLQALVFQHSVNQMIEEFHKLYVGLRAILEGFRAFRTLGCVGGVITPGYLEFTVRLLNKKELRDKAAGALILPPLSLNPVVGLDKKL